MSQKSCFHPYPLPCLTTPTDGSTVHFPICWLAAPHCPFFSMVRIFKLGSPQCREERSEVDPHCLWECMSVHLRISDVTVKTFVTLIDKDNAKEIETHARYSLQHFLNGEKFKTLGVLL